KFNIRYSIFCGSLFNPAAKAASLIIKKPCHFGVVSHGLAYSLPDTPGPDLTLYESEGRKMSLLQRTVRIPHIAPGRAEI
ncbi:MAG: hypothetical protein WCB15_06325, partial [Desulfobacterales bacterium]